MAERAAAWDAWNVQFNALQQLAAVEQDLMRLGYFRARKAHYQRAAHRLPLPPCWTCGGPAIGRFPDGSALYRHSHAQEGTPYVDEGHKEEF